MKRGEKVVVITRNKAQGTSLYREQQDPSRVGKDSKQINGRQKKPEKRGKDRQGSFLHKHGRDGGDITKANLLMKSWKKPGYPKTTSGYATT